MEKYLETLILGVQEGKVTVAKAKIQAYQRMGITNNTFEEFQSEIASFKKQFKREYLQKNKEKELSFGEIQHFLSLQIDFFQNEGEDLAREIIKATFCWPKDKKQYIKLVIPLIIIDKALKDFPNIDEAQFESAKSTLRLIIGKYREQLGDELYRLSEVSQNFTKIIRQYLNL